MSKLTRRNFLGAAAVIAGGLTGLQRVLGAELHGADRSKWQGANDRRGHRQQGAHDGLSRGRCRIRPEDFAPLRREHRRHRSGVPGDVRQGRSFSGPFLLGVAGSYSAGSGHGAPEHRQSDFRCNSQKWRRGNAAVVTQAGKQALRYPPESHNHVERFGTG